MSAWGAAGVGIGALILIAGGIKALPTIWQFVVAAGQAPLVIQNVAKEFSPNGGGSMRDAINRIENRVDEHDQKLVDLADLRDLMRASADGAR